MSFRIERGQIIPLANSKTKSTKEASNIDFQKILQESLAKENKIKISAHAKQRMIERDIVLDDADINILNNAINDLEKKGARESLMLYKDMALIASVSNRTIITALEDVDMEIVTNIDSAIIIK